MRYLISALLLAPAVALAAPPKIAVAGSGDCSDAELAQAVRSLSAALATQPAVSLLTESEAQGVLGRGPTRSVEEIQRQIEAARQHFYQAKYHRAVDDIEAVQAEIQRMPPGNDRWGLWVSARIIEGLIRTRLKGDNGTEDAFRAVLRLEPTYQLDPDYYGPSTLSLFDRVRKELQKTKRERLVVKSTPSGAEVFLDGRKVGATPYNATHIPGAYQLVVGKGDGYSIPREVEVTSAQNELHVDLRFEGALDTSRGTCISRPADENTRLNQAVKLGALLDVEQVVVLRFDRNKGPGSSWLDATLVRVKGGERIRAGGLQVNAEGLSETGIQDLARYVATGETSERVVANRPAPVEQPEVDAVAKAPSSTPRTWQRPVGQGLVGLGAALLIGGGVMTGLGVSAQSDYDAWESRGRPPEGGPEAREALDRAAVFKPLGYTGLGLGAVAAGAGAFLWLTAPPTADAPSVSVLPTGPNAAQVTLFGHF